MSASSVTNFGMSRAHIFLQDEERHYLLMDTIKTTLRHHVSLDDMKSTSDPFGLRKGKTPDEAKVDTDHYIRATNVTDLGCASLFHQVKIYRFHMRVEGH